MPKKLLIVLLLLTLYSFYNARSRSAEPISETIPAKKIVLTPANSKSVFSTRVHFEDSVKTLYNRIGLPGYKLPYEIFRKAMIGYYSLEQEGALGAKKLLTIIDFSKPSTAKRFYTIDLKSLSVKFHTFVAHGKNTGGNLATVFSNTPNSNQSSLGFYVTAETYVGSKGYSLRLDGMEKNFNDNIRNRAVVMHAAKYATKSWIDRYGRLGRSQGCPALPPQISKEVIDTIKEGTAIFTYYPDENYLTKSRYLKLDRLFDAPAEPIRIPERKV